MFLTVSLSRAYIEGEPETSHNKEMSCIVHSLVENTTVSAAKMDKIREESVTKTPMSMCIAGLY